MNASEIKRRVKSFRREYGMKEASSVTLEDIFVRQGFTIIYYNPILNDPDVETVINSFDLKEMIRHSNGFLYMDQDHRLVFLKENLTEEEKRIVLAHEEGHYYCGHSTHSDVMGRNVAEEFEANEFAHYLLEEPFTDRIKKTADKNRKKLFLFAAIILITVGFVIFIKEYREHKLYEGEYYVTEHGEKYHIKGCVTIEGHKTRRLTREDVQAGKYAPCSVCQPDH